jgi:hypothetical protein
MRRNRARSVRWRQKESRWQNQGKKKAPVTKVTTSKKSRKVRKNQDNQKKGSEEGAAPASIAKEGQADRDGRTRAIAA